jgi:CspA family cold shock protein
MQLLAHIYLGELDMTEQAAEQDQICVDQARTESHVKWFNEKKGYGFIVNPEDAKADIFVHYRNIDGEGFKVLYEGNKVSCVLEKGDKGLKALEVVIVEE